MQFVQLSARPSNPLNLSAPTARTAPSDPSCYELTVAICTYNGAARLPAVLSCLQQQASADCRWEVLVIDNNSTDDTRATVRSLQASWPAHIPLRYVFEPQQGTAFARHRAVLEAQASLVGFIDDDNLPTPTWVAAACSFAQTHPRVGAFGSRVNGQFDCPLPAGFDRIQPFFAITQRGPDPHRYERRKRVLPPAAGLVVRRQAWLNHVPKQMMLLGAAGATRLAGEDIEALSYIQSARWEIWHNPAMVIDHQIPGWRLQRDYLMPFFRSIGFSRHVTRMIRFRPLQRPLAFLVYLASDTRKLILHLVRHQGRLRTDLVAACELQLFISSLVSPFYVWGKLWSSRINS